MKNIYCNFESSDEIDKTCGKQNIPITEKQKNC